MGKKLQYKVFNSLIFLFCLFFTNNSYAVSLLSLQNVVDWSCMNFQVVGPCYKPTPPYVGVKVRYWEPVLLAETVKKPGDSAIDELGAIISPMVEGASKSLMQQETGLSIPMSSGSVTSSSDNTNLQFNEVHLYKFPFDDLVNSTIGASCSNTPSALAPIIYLSELDAPEWRIGVFEALSPKSLLSGSLGPVCAVLNGHSQGLCMGYWGPVYPRRGFIPHQSEVVGAAADVYRGASLSSFEDISFHKTVSKLTFSPDPDKDRLQVLYPFPSGCFNIGENPALWESGKTSLNGKYVFVYWRYQECCIY